MSIKSEVDEKMVSNTSFDCNICNDKSEKIAKIHYLIHKEDQYVNCLKCKELHQRIENEHFQEHVEELYNTSSFPCDICQPKFNKIFKEHTIAVLFKNTEYHNNENIIACTECTKVNFEVLSLHFDKHFNEGEISEDDVKTGDFEEISCENSIPLNSDFSDVTLICDEKQIETLKKKSVSLQ